MVNNDKQERKRKIGSMFDNIAPKYDLLNRTLSIGTDVYWRKRALKLTQFSENTILLDIACGTGDFAIEAKKMGVDNIIGADYSLPMLRLFNKKSSWINGKTVRLVAEQIPLKDKSVTNITVAFGVRNFYDLKEAFTCFYNVLKPKGKVTILEFSMPKNRVLRPFYYFYINTILPFLGKIVSGHPIAYSYLPESVKEFDKNVDLVTLLKNTGFPEVRKHMLTFGLVQVVIARK